MLGTLAVQLAVLLADSASDFEYRGCGGVVFTSSTGGLAFERKRFFRPRAEGTLQGMLARSGAEWAAEPGLDQGSTASQFFMFWTKMLGLPIAPLSMC